MFAQRTLKVDELEYAFSIDLNDHVQVIGLISHATLQAAIVGCRSPVVVVEDKYIRLAHQSVQDFFTELSEEE